VVDVLGDAQGGKAEQEVKRVQRHNVAVTAWLVDNAPRGGRKLTTG